MMENAVVFVVVGRLGSSLTTSKVVPIACSGGVRQVYVFRDQPGEALDGVRYISSPEWLKKVRPFKHMVEFLQLLYWAIRVRPDYINGVYTLPKGLHSVLVAMLTGSRSIVSIIGGPIEIETYYKPKWFWKGLNLWMIRRCDVVTTKGRAVSNYLIEHGIRRDKIFEFNGSIDTERFRCDDSVPRDIDILFVGYFTELKGPDRVLEVVRRLKSDIPGLRAVFLGEGEMLGQIRGDIKQNGLGENVILQGYVPDTEKWFQRSKILLMPSRTEGLSTAMLEAMSCGCVPVVSNVGNMTDAAWHEKNAMVVDDYLDIDGFYRSSQALLERPEQRERLSVCGKKLVYSTYSVEAQAQVFNSMVEISS